MPIHHRLLLTLLLAQPSADSAEEAAPLGSAVVLDSASGAVGIHIAALAAVRYPWQTICYYLGSPIHDEGIVLAFQELPPSTLVVRPSAATPEREAACIATLRRSAPPTTAQFAEYVAARAGNPEFNSALRTALDPAPAGHRSTVSRQLAKANSLTASEWRAIYSLTMALPIGPPSAERAGARIAREGRTIHRWCCDYLGVEFGVAKDRFGWRWIPEAALRRAGMVGAGAVGGRMEA